jgi:hypothetical protein
LSESTAAPSGEPKMAVVRLIWGKTWNVPGVVAEIAERLEEFAASGAPRRSLLTMRFVRVNESDDQPRPAASLTPSELAVLQQIRADSTKAAPAADRTGIAGGFSLGGRADLIASRAYRSESMWRLVLASNGISDPFQDLAGRPLTLLPRSVLGGLGGSN